MIPTNLSLGVDTMKSVYAVTLCVLLLLVSACAQKVNNPNDVQAIKNLASDYVKNDKPENSAWYTSTCYLDGAVRMPPNAASITGKEAIGKQIQAYYAENNRAKFELTVDEVLSSGDLAIARGKYTSESTSKASGLAALNDQGKWADAYQRQSDGSWKVIFDIWNSDKPSPGATSDGVEEQALLQMERDWAAAILKKDTAVVDKFLAKEFVSNLPGRTLNKTQLLAEMKTNPAKIESAENSDMLTMVFGDTAVVHGLYTEKSTTNGKDTSLKGRWTEVYAKRDGRWQCVTQYSAKVQ
jgi:ketosteroid isomerase-like protein